MGVLLTRSSVDSVSPQSSSGAEITRTDFIAKVPFSTVVDRVVRTLHKNSTVVSVDHVDAIVYALTELAAVDERKAPESWGRDKFRSGARGDTRHLVTDRRADIASADRIRVIESTDGKRVELALYRALSNEQTRIFHCCDGVQIENIVCGVRLWPEDGFMYHNGDRWVTS